MDLLMYERIIKFLADTWEVSQKNHAELKSRLDQIEAKLDAPLGVNDRKKAEVVSQRMEQPMRTNQGIAKKSNPMINRRTRVQEDDPDNFEENESDSEDVSRIKRQQRDIDAELDDDGEEIPL